METLPRETLTEIFSHLSPPEQLKSERVSKQFQDVSQKFNLNYLKNYIQYLPDEKIEEICNQLPTKDLANLMRSKSKIYQICHHVLEKREAEKLFTYHLAANLDSNQKSQVWLYENPDGPGFIFEQQERAEPPELPVKRPWILKDFKDQLIEVYEGNDMGINVYSRKAKLDNLSELVTAIRRLKDKGYVKLSNFRFGSQSRF